MLLRLPYPAEMTAGLGQYLPGTLSDLAGLPGMVRVSPQRFSIGRWREHLVVLNLSCPSDTPQASPRSRTGVHRRGGATISLSSPMREDRARSPTRARCLRWTPQRLAPRISFRTLAARKDQGANLGSGCADLSAMRLSALCPPRGGPGKNKGWPGTRLDRAA